MERYWKLDKNESLNWKYRTLYRVVLTKDCEHGNTGQRMGWIEKEENLQDNAMVFDNAKVFDNATICGSVEIYGDAAIGDNIIINC